MRPSQSQERRGKLSGIGPETRLAPGSHVAAAYGDKDVIEEEFSCTFEVNPEFEWTAWKRSFQLSRADPIRECRARESTAHEFLIATLFQPQLSSRAGHPHPLVLAFGRALVDYRRKRLADSILA
jgi:CTP synthase (UTP-ammonia lyase)